MVIFLIYIYRDPCYYCDNKNCKNCDFEYSEDIKMEDLLGKIQGNRSDSKIEFEIFWRKVSPKYPKLEDIFDIEKVEMM